MCKCNKSPCGCTFSYEVQLAELEQWLQEHPDSDIEAIREVRRKIGIIKKEQNQINTP